MKDFLAFRKMITPVVIQILFWVGVIGCVLAGLLAIAQGAGQGAVGGVLGGLVILFLGPLAIRVYCELLILLFRINESLDAIKKKLGS